MTKEDLSQQFNLSRLKYEALERKIDKILDNQEVLIKQLLFLMDYSMGDDEKRRQIKEDLQRFSKEQERVLQ